MKMTQWIKRSLVLLLVVFLLIGTPPLGAASRVSPSSSENDEHPWDIFKTAYRVEILLVTSNYIVLAVWYTKEQSQPTIIRIDLRSDSPSKNSEECTKKTYIFTE